MRRAFGLLGVSRQSDLEPEDQSSESEQQVKGRPDHTDLQREIRQVKNVHLRFGHQRLLSRPCRSPRGRKTVYRTHPYWWSYRERKRSMHKK